MLLSSASCDAAALDLDDPSDPPEPLVRLRFDCLGIAGISCCADESEDAPAASFFRGFLLRRVPSAESLDEVPSDWFRLDCFGLVDVGLRSGESAGDCRTGKSSMLPLE